MKLARQCGTIFPPPHEPSTRMESPVSRRPLPQDPMIRALIAQARQTQVNRRTLLAGAGAGAAALALAACSTGGGQSKPTPAADTSANDKTLNWANWAAYIDEDDAGNYPTLQAFEEQTGIKVNYEVAVDDNNTYYGKVKDQLALGQDIGADTACLTDWMIARWIRSLARSISPRMASAPALTPSADALRLSWESTRSLRSSIS